MKVLRSLCEFFVFEVFGMNEFQHRVLAHTESHRLFKCSPLRSGHPDPRCALWDTLLGLQTCEHGGKDFVVSV
jgi:hypothetical protein